MDLVAAKIVIIGNAKVGKTSIIEQLTKNTFHPSYIPTIVSEETSKKVIVGNSLITMQIWDTAGQDKYQSLQKFINKKIDGCIIVFDLTDINTFNALKMWKDKFIYESGILEEDFPFYVIGSKADLNWQRKIKCEDSVGWCKNNDIMRYFEITARSADNVREVFEELSKSIIEYKHRKTNREKFTEVSSDMKCMFHKGFIRSQYCRTCDKLICLKCQIDHIEANGHQVMSVNDMILMITKKIEENSQRLKDGKILIGSGEMIEEILTRQSDRIMDIKDEIKKEVCELLDDIFEKKIETQLHRLSNEYENISNKFGVINSDNYHTERKREQLNKLLYNDHNYQKIVDIYKDVAYNRKDSTFQHITSIKTVQVELSRLINIAENLKFKLKNAVSFCIRPGIWEQEFEKAFKLEDKELIYDQLQKKSEYINRWGNGSKVYQGGSSEWMTFCSDNLMPGYFKCRIKVLEAYDPDNGGRFIGVSTNKCDGTGNFYEKSNNWWALNNNLGLWSKDKCGKSRGNITYGDRGDIVTILYGRNKNLNFEVNGISTGSSFEGLQGPFYLACSDRTSSRYEILDISML